MLIRYKGIPANRIVGSGVVVYKWTRGSTVEIPDALLVLNLLTNSRDDFEIDPLDPLVQLLGVDKVGDWVVAGVVTVQGYYSAIGRKINEKTSRHKTFREVAPDKSDESE